MLKGFCRPSPVMSKTCLRHGPLPIECRNGEREKYSQRHDFARLISWLTLHFLKVRAVFLCYSWGMEKSAQIAPGTPVERTFARKVRLSTWALFFERLWPRLWILLGLIAVFATLSLAGIWPMIPHVLHGLILAALAAAALAAVVYAARVPWPNREDAVRRIERRSGVAHRPASSYEDELTANSENPATNALWQAHRSRLAAAIDRLKVGNPSPRADRFDPMALRALTLLALVPAAALVTGSFKDRLASAFRFGAPVNAIETRVDAWVTPPPYTGLPPLMLADGAQPTGAQVDPKTASEPSKLHEVPDKSLLVLRGTGFQGQEIALEVLTEGAKEPIRTAAAPPKVKANSKDPSKDLAKSSVSEVRVELRKPARVRALAGSKELGAWTFDVTPDKPPAIALDKGMERTPKGSLKLAYKAEDDYGVASAVAKLRQAAPKPGDPAKAWAKAPPLKGPRLPLERPPELALKMPRAGSKAVEGTTLLELGAHPWAGQRAELWLEATDVAGQIGKSPALELVLPSRRFSKPLARALLEQRRKLAEDSRNRPYVARALDAVSMEPEGFITRNGIYLGIRMVYHRLEREKSRTAIRSSIEELWKLALKVEDGSLSDAEQTLKDAQDRLSKALERGADDKEIQALMAELKAALNQYVEEMQKKAQDEDPQAPGDQDQQPQISQQDLDKMMADLEKTAKNGSREDAEKMLAELKELMERMKAGNSKEAREQDKKAKEAMKKLNQLSDLAGKQRQLMDDTFKEQKKQQGDKPGGKKGDQAGGAKRPGQKGQQGEKSEQGQDGQQKAENGERGRQPGEGHGALRERQEDVRKNLEKLQKDLEDIGMGDPEKLGNAENAMREAEDQLEKGNLDSAADQQAQALEQMRQSAQQMAEQMSKESQQRLGKGDKPRDPFDRPQKSEGPDLGNSVKVPNAIDAQRARDILDELRKRSGQALRPPVELDYLERLLKRF